MIEILRGRVDVVEVVADIKLRDAYQLTDGSVVDVELDLTTSGAGRRLRCEN